MSAAPKAKPAPKTSAKVSTNTKVDFSVLDLKSADDVVSWMNDVGLEELEIEQAGVKIRLKRPSFGAPAMPAAPAPQPVAAAVVETATPATNEANMFKSPIVGTFYRSASPEASPFVKEGDVVKAGQTLCIIEAMKTMNQVEADRAGKITKIMATDAQPIEFGEPLFVIE